ncbi:serine hydrolase [Plantactinospora sp. WMMB782]|uniref:serine hydrolase n=1 Tax=Plantactinospora sp. WMMB782 TaxID=3404121 RepID=UPI003B9225A8
MSIDPTAMQDRVQAVLDRLVASGQETGLQAAAYLHGELVVDAVAGLADPGTGTAVTRDTLFHSFSTGKGVPPPAPANSSTTAPTPPSPHACPNSRATSPAAAHQPHNRPPQRPGINHRLGGARRHAVNDEAALTANASGFTPSLGA